MPRILPAEGPQLAIEGQRRKALPSTVEPVKHGPRQFGPPPTVQAVEQKAVEKPKRKADPKLVAAARELRDRWLEKVNSLQLEGAGKYDVSRMIAGDGGVTKQLAA